MNQIIVFCDTIKDWIAPSMEPYRFLSEKPKRIGDEADIEVGDLYLTVVEGHLSPAGVRRVRVMLCESKMGRRCFKWLVEVRK